METNLKFNSQICTTRSQSERLLALGLKKATADMGIVKSTNEIYVGYPTDYSFENDLHIPAWSLHRLIEMMPYNITVNNNTYELQIAYKENFDNGGFEIHRYNSEESHSTYELALENALKWVLENLV